MACSEFRRFPKFRSGSVYLSLWFVYTIIPRFSVPGEGLPPLATGFGLLAFKIGDFRFETDLYGVQPYRGTRCNTHWIAIHVNWFTFVPTSKWTDTARAAPRPRVTDRSLNCDVRFFRFLCNCGSRSSARPHTTVERAELANVLDS